MIHPLTQPLQPWKMAVRTSIKEENDLGKVRRCAPGLTAGTEWGLNPGPLQGLSPAARETLARVFEGDGNRESLLEALFCIARSEGSVRNVCKAEFLHLGDTPGAAGVLISFGLCKRIQAFSPQGRQSSLREGLPKGPCSELRVLRREQGFRPCDKCVKETTVLTSVFLHPPRTPIRHGTKNLPPLGVTEQDGPPPARPGRWGTS